MDESQQINKQKNQWLTWKSTKVNMLWSFKYFPRTASKREFCDNIPKKYPGTSYNDV